MFSHLVTAAKGLFARNEHVTNDRPTMVSATRRGVVGTAKSATEPAMNGKRKAESATTKKAEGQQAKRRKRDSLEATETTLDGQDQTPTAPSAQTKHMRFDSEEPELPEETKPEETSETPTQKEDDDDSDDDAPEAIDNSAQLLKIKEHAKKLEVAKQMYVSSQLFPTPALANIRVQRGTVEKGETAETGRAPKTAGQIDRKGQRNQRTGR
jgi:U3 small nucleolar RNA-associated protein 16